jgi:hypothetical protein
MVTRRQALAVALLIGAAGCTGSSFLAVTARNVTEMPIQHCDQIRMEQTNRHRAERAWGDMVKGFPEQCWSKDYERGFKDGFADYLDNGGNGEPPATPPFCYRLWPYQTPQGLREIDEWYAGFRHGSGVARTTGLRETIVIPLSSPPINAVERFPSTDPPLGGPVSLPRPIMPPAKQPEELPRPKPVPPPN